MEFIGLLGLLGLLGFFSSRSLAGRFNELKDFVRRSGGSSSAVETRVADNEKAVAEIVGELRHLNSLLQNCATNGELSKISTRLQNEIQSALSKVPADPRISEILARLDALERKPAPSQISEPMLKIIDSRLSSLEQKISQLENKPAPPPPSVQIPDALLSRITLIEHRLSALEQRPATIVTPPPPIVTPPPPPKVSEPPKPKISEPPKPKISEPPKPKVSEPTKPKVLEPPPQPPVTEPLKISAFQIKKTGRPLFSNKPEDAAQTLAAVENLAPLLDFLESSGFEKKDAFIRIVRNYQQNLASFAKNLQRGKFDADNFSEEATDAFFSTLSRYFLEKIPVSIYRGSRENPAFYSAFLKKVSAYLSACRVYTKLIEPGKRLNSDDLDAVSVIIQNTPERAKDKIIEEVERLPYFVDYLTDNGETEYFCCEGKISLLKFDGGAK